LLLPKKLNYREKNSKEFKRNVVPLRIETPSQTTKPLARLTDPFERGRGE
jgi:hypothetical protein